MTYGSWDIRHGGQSILSFWTSFCPLTLRTTRKIRILKKFKKHLEILLFYTCVPQMTIIWCMVPEIGSVTDIIFCHFEPFLSFYPTNYPKKQNFEKERKSLDISSFYTCVPQMTNIWYMVLEIWNVTDRFFCHFGLLFHTIFCMFFFLNNPEN